MGISASRKRGLSTTMAIAVVTALSAQVAELKPDHFRVASYASDGFDVNSRLIIFPSEGKEFSVPLPATLRYVVYGASGQTVYAGAFKRLDSKTGTHLPGLFKIELSPVRLNPLPGLDSFSSIGRFAVSRLEDMILFAGVRNDSGSRTCGIYELNLPAGNLRPVLETTDCKAESPWRVFDISPDGTGALITADRHLAVVDLVTGKLSPLEKDLWVGSYSPDGKWIAALELGAPGQSKTVLIDPKDSSRRRDLGGTNDDEVVWSPDSRFLLHAVYRPACPSRNPLALETLDAETGKRIILKSSICNAGSGREIGWVSSKIGR